MQNRLLIYLRWVIAICLLFASSVADAVDLKPEAVQGFDEYVRLTESRMQDELAPGAFLWVDRLPESRRSETYARLQRGEVIAERLQTADPSGRSATPGALIHHWVGTVFIPGVSLAQVLAVVQDYDRHAEYYKPDVMRSETAERDGNDFFKVRYRLRKKKILTIVLDADYDVHRHSLDATHAYSISTSTRIAQIENAGQPDEHELPPGKDGGYMWRLNSYWHYFDSGRGVYVQCEAISLTRDIPAGLNWLIGSFVQSIPKESLDFTLRSTRNAVLRGGSHTGR